MDATEKGHTGLATYYTEKGETPGVWVGSGMAGIDGLDAGDVVTADQMQSLFGSGHHPLATERTKELDLRIGRPTRPTPTEADYKAATRLGMPYKVYENDVSAFRIEVAKRIAAVNEAAGLPGDWPVPAAERARIRTEVGARVLPRRARPRPGRRARARRHDRQALPAQDQRGGRVRPHLLPGQERLGAVGARRPEDRRGDRAGPPGGGRGRAGLPREQGAVHPRWAPTGSARSTSAAWSPPRSPTATPAPATPTCTPTSRSPTRCRPSTDGKWLAIDGRVLFKAKVSASETYNTALERHLVDALGVRFAERPEPRRPQAAGARDRRRRPRPERTGSPSAGTASRPAARCWPPSSRRTHGRPPTPVETLQLAQQATLETREAKHEPRSLAEQREAWRARGDRGPRRSRSGSSRCSAARSTRPPRAPPPSRRRGVGRQDRRPDRRRRWRAAAPPGRSGTSTPRRSARSGPPTCPPTR